jgi:hypothetical protein
MQNEHEKELFSSASNIAGGSNDNTGIAIVGSVVVGFILAVIFAGLGIKGGIVMVIPALLVFATYKAIKNKK